jgi:hypothetical protein
MYICLIICVICVCGRIIVSVIDMEEEEREDNNNNV